MAARLVEIDDAAAPVLEPYTKIKERDLIGRERLFVAEGEVVVRVLVTRSRLRVRSLLVERRRLEAIADVLARLPDETPAYVVPQSVMDGVVGFAIHRGILALGERGDDREASAIVEHARIVVGLVGLTNHDNVGGIFRSAAAFAAGAVLLDDACCDPLYRKSIRVSAGAALLLPFARSRSAHDLIDVTTAAGLTPIALTPRGSVSVADLPPGRYALLLGTEGPGLSDDVIARVRGVRVDMPGALDSLNVGVAAAIALHRLS